MDWSSFAWQIQCQLVVAALRCEEDFCLFDGTVWSIDEWATFRHSSNTAVITDYANKIRKKLIRSHKVWWCLWQRIVMKVLSSQCVVLIRSHKVWWCLWQGIVMKVLSSQCVVLIRSHKVWWCLWQGIVMKVLSSQYVLLSEFFLSEQRSI